MKNDILLLFSTFYFLVMYTVEALSFVDLFLPTAGFEHFMLQFIKEKNELYKT